MCVSVYESIGIAVRSCREQTINKTGSCFLTPLVLCNLTQRAVFNSRSSSFAPCPGGLEVGFSWDCCSHLLQALGVGGWICQLQQHPELLGAAWRWGWRGKGRGRGSNERERTNRNRHLWICYLRGRLPAIISSMRNFSCVAVGMSAGWSTTT